VATISIRRPHRLAHEEVKRKAENLARRIETKHHVSWRWEGENLRLTAPPGPARGATGVVRVTPDHVSIDIDLPLLLRPVRGMVETRLIDKLDRLLGPA
jgi:putative polyhydroxyalkanoate system protein